MADLALSFNLSSDVFLHRKKDEHPGSLSPSESRYLHAVIAQKPSSKGRTRLSLVQILHLTVTAPHISTNPREITLQPFQTHHGLQPLPGIANNPPAPGIPKLSLAVLVILIPVKPQKTKQDNDHVKPVNFWPFPGSREQQTAPRGACFTKLPSVAIHAIISGPRAFTPRKLIKDLTYRLPKDDTV
ncbi:hypothetical protein LXL04_039288 [Taraxacum kok-saghyz]